MDAQGLADATAPNPDLETPEDSGAPVTLNGDAGTIELDIPGEADAQRVTDETVVYGESADEASVSVQPVADGFRALITIPNADQPRSYAFPIGGDVATIAPDHEGGLLLLSENGEQIGQIAAPWAVDAAGNDVPTHFEVNGTTVTQIVEHDMAGVAYPIVADPWIAAAALAAAAWCAKGVLASVPSSALYDIVNGKASSWKSYATNAAVGCLVGEVGSWVWKWLPGKAKTWAINQVFKLILKWR